MSIHESSDHRGHSYARRTVKPQQPAAAVFWTQLSRPEKKALARLLGGGSLRGIAPETVDDLYHLGLIDGDDQFAQLTSAGWSTLKTSRDWLRR